MADVTFGIVGIGLNAHAPARFTLKAITNEGPEAGFGCPERGARKIIQLSGQRRIHTGKNQSHKQAPDALNSNLVTIELRIDVRIDFTSKPTPNYLNL
jgi:hypothetical protein